MAADIQLQEHGITVSQIWRNAAPALLYELALQNEKGSAIASSGALIALSGVKTGRSPNDKRIVEEPTTKDDIWWGKVNIPMDEEVFHINRERAVDYLNSLPGLFIVDGFAGWDPRHRIKVRIICARAYHALFMHNMLIRPTAEELESFGSPDYVIYNAGSFPANGRTRGMTSKTSIDLHFGRREFVILGTEYAGEMKKGVFTIMNYIMPKAGVLSMHCSANQGADGDVSLFFGLSGTGKTTLSADPRRLLIGDDEHCWTDEGVFNIEGGCYAKVINLSAAAEPEIYGAIRFGSVLENVVYDALSREVDYPSQTITENTRGSYPIEFIPNALIPCVGGHPKNVILLTCDAFGVLPPVSRLTPGQAMYHFISGYTAKLAGTEQGVTEPQATFSACFGAAFLVWHPVKYAHMLAEKLEATGATVWLVNTGWIGGPAGDSPGAGKRISLKYTRAIIDSIHAGQLSRVATAADPVFGLAVPVDVAGVPSEILNPRAAWPTTEAYDAAAFDLARRFRKNFEVYAEGATPDILAGGPIA